MIEERTLRQKISMVVGIVGLVLLLLGIAVFFGKKPEKYFDLTDEIFYGTYQSADIRSVELDIGYGEVQILSGTQFQLKYNGVEADDFKMELVNNVLKIQYDVSAIDSVYMSSRDAVETKFELVLPNKLYEDIKIESFNGKVSVKGVSCNALDINTTKSDVKLDKVTANQSSVLDMSMTDMDIESCTINSADFICGTGSLTVMKSTLNDCKLDCFTGDIRIASCLLQGSSEIKGGMGNINVMLLGDKASYGFSFLDGNDDIKVAGESYKNYDNTTSDNNILVNGGMGEITINFYE